MYAFLHLTLQNPCTLGLVVVGYFEYMGSIDPVIVTAAHHMVAVYIEFENRDLITL